MAKGDSWRFFAGTVLGITAIMRFFDAIWAWTYNGSVPGGLQGALFGHTLATYGWVYFVIGLILLASSFGVMSGSQSSRWIGIGAGGLLAVSAVWWLPYYPIWSLVYIAIGILVIYALLTYGERTEYDETAGYASEYRPPGDEGFGPDPARSVART